MFPRSKVLRAVEFKAPFLQCDSFHIMSIPEIQGERERERERGDCLTFSSELSWE